MQQIQLYSGTGIITLDWKDLGDAGHHSFNGQLKLDSRETDGYKKPFHGAGSGNPLSTWCHLRKKAWFSEFPFCKAYKKSNQHENNCHMGRFCIRISLMRVYREHARAFGWLMLIPSQLLAPKQCGIISHINRNFIVSVIFVAMGRAKPFHLGWECLEKVIRSACSC